MDIFKKLTEKITPLGQYQKTGDGYYLFPKLEGEIHPHMIFNGKKVLTWSINNYLGLANHPEVREADAKGAADWGLAYPMGARIMTGQTSLHEKLENELSDYSKRESSYLLNYGYQGIMSVIDTLVDRKDVIVYDSEDHASILDGVRLHMGKRFVYKHNDIESLRSQLKHAEKITEKSGGGILVITEGVFGMSGDLGKLDEIVALKDEFNFRLLIDDAHGFGTMGSTGAGTDEHFDVQDKVDLYFGTFAKSMASIGAFISGPKEIIDVLRFNMRSQVFAKSLPMPLVYGALKRLDLIRRDTLQKDKLWEIVVALQNGLKSKGFDLGNSNSPVTPVFFKGEVGEATNVLLDLRENYGIFCSIVVYPVVPKGTIMLRIIPTADHTLDDVNRTVNAFSEIHEKLTNGVYEKEITTMNV